MVVSEKRYTKLEKIKKSNVIQKCDLLWGEEEEEDILTNILQKAQKSEKIGSEKKYVKLGKK